MDKAHQLWLMTNDKIKFYHGKGVKASTKELELGYPEPTWEMQDVALSVSGTLSRFHSLKFFIPPFLCWILRTYDLSRMTQSPQSPFICSDGICTSFGLNCVTDAICPMVAASCGLEQILSHRLEFAANFKV